MSIQPGPGYTFNASSQGINLSIEKPWERWNDQPFVQQFQVAAYTVGNQVRLMLAKGAVNYSVSQMPFIWKNPQIDKRQIWLYGTSVRPGIGKVNLDAPQSSPWMEDGGYYTIPGAGFYYVVICKPDFNGNNNSKGDDPGWTNSQLLQQNVPFICIFSSTDAIYEKVFSETGPSLYTQWTNIARMEGYDKDSTELEADWGACHTTWFNPVKYGYACKIIATVEVTTVDSQLSANVRQHVIGSIDLPMEQQFFGTMLVDVEDWKEDTDDPYIINEESNFNSIVNKNLRASMNALPVSVATGFYLKMLSPDDWTDTNYNLYYECTGGGCKHPFYVTKHVVDDAVKYSVCVGSLNNVMLPESDMLAGIETDGWVYIRGQFDAANKVFPQNPDGVAVLYANGNMPADTDEFGRIAICRVTNVTSNPETAVFTQLVTGSLWGDRIKLGGDSARYYFARV
jgi:hypothetical protein